MQNTNLSFFISNGTFNILKIKYFYLFFFLFLTTSALFSQSKQVITGAEQTEKYLPLLKGQRIALFSNHTGIVGNKHTLDILLENKINVSLIFSPEHGFSGNADAGEKVSSSIDDQTGIPVISLYDGKSQNLLQDYFDKFDILVVDIQDVGVRFYTYYITMVRLMDKCAEQNKKMIIFDRPNPLGFYVDGPVLDMKYKSGVGWLPIPVVYGMTLGELALMVNGENWLSNQKKCDVTVIKCLNYTHKTKYQLPVAPSPNLPNMQSVYLYPSLCYFEATPISLGRGTNKPFQLYGHPNMKGYNFTFTPKSIAGAKNPPQLNRLCYGVDLSDIPQDEIFRKGIDLSYLIDAYQNMNLDDFFFNPFFEKLIGVDSVRKMIESGKSADEIKTSWRSDLEKFKIQRKPYLLYEE